MFSGQPERMPEVRSMVDKVLSEIKEAEKTSKKTVWQVVDEVKAEVIGQDEAVEQLALMISGMMSRNFLALDGKKSERELPRLKGVLLHGPTAAGKTHLVTSVLRAMGIRHVLADCTQLSAEGWKGASVCDLAKEAQDILKCEEERQVAIVFDEFDKLSFDQRDDLRSSNAQRDLLKLLDGGTYFHPSNGDGSSEVRLDTNRCFFLFLGAFADIEDVVRRRLSKSMPSTIGFASAMSGPTLDSLTEKELRKLASHEDFHEYGLMRELLGRMSSIIHVPALSVTDMTSVVKGCTNCFEQRFSSLAPEGAKVIIEEDAAAEIARRAIESGLGARQIETTLAPLVLRRLAGAPGKEKSAGSVVISRLDLERSSSDDF